ncbi:tetratricopeptide repeat protein [Coraliomargarita sp. SDUM461003]|uniref:Tetratricopeptide repeat protein n=1 Tax=Thalassobacterium maritimum TaxID=3041265 RepID=A0ABU1AX40_9BACT|nr:tetratricopeptide repeat protein [Coraliomargarita sp. SDUM461003]MDQ8207547.1 tetratricopeptide repeat protein [Coraliomargarita sp. SDUM461003]
MNHPRAAFFSAQGTLLSLIFILLAPVQSQADGIEQLVDQVHALDTETWLGWTEETPSRLYLLRSGETPQAIAELPAPAYDLAVQSDGYVIGGSGYLAQASLDAPGQLSYTELTGEWTAVVANAIGYLASNGEVLQFSADGRNWMPAPDGTIAPNSQIAGLTAEGGLFVLLCHLEVKEGSQSQWYSTLSTSENGTDWEMAFYEITPGEPSILHLAYGEGIWAGFGIGQYIYSKDGYDWQAASTVIPSRGRNLQFFHRGGQWFRLDVGKEEITVAEEIDDLKSNPSISTKALAASSFWTVGEGGLRSVALDSQQRVVAQGLEALTAQAAATAPQPDAAQLTQALPPLPEPSWPPAQSDGWSAEEFQQMKALHARHLAFSREVMAFRSSLNGEPDLDAWQALLDRHQALLQDPQVDALYQAYVRRGISAFNLTTSADPVDSHSWRFQLEKIQSGLVNVAINPDLWCARARMLQWSGQLEEARRDASIAALMVRLPTKGGNRLAQEQLFSDANRLKLELNLPASVLAVPQLPIQRYMIPVATQNAVLGKELSEDSEAEVLKLFQNFGHRLAAAWQLADPEQALETELTLYQIHSWELTPFAFPSEALKEIAPLMDALDQQLKRNSQQAMPMIKELLQQAPHPSFLSLRAKVLGQMGEIDQARRLLEAISVGWATDRYTKAILAELDQATATQNTQRYLEALDAFNRNDAATGQAKLDAILASGLADTRSLLLQAEVYQTQGQPAQAMPLLRRAYTENRASAIAAAQLCAALIGQQQLAEVREILGEARRAHPDDLNLQAIEHMTTMMQQVQNGQSGPAAAIETLAQLDALSAQDERAYVLQGVRSQLNMMLQNKAAAAESIARMIAHKPYVPPQMYLQLGLLYQQLNQVAEAKRYFQRAFDHGLPQAEAYLRSEPR